MLVYSGSYPFHWLLTQDPGFGEPKLVTQDGQSWASVPSCRHGAECSGTPSPSKAQPSWQHGVWALLRYTDAQTLGPDTGTGQVWAGCLGGCCAEEGGHDLMCILTLTRRLGLENGPRARQDAGSPPKRFLQ